MKAKLLKREQGFTIIEVLIVLAIAGLIMLIVFLAVPALQRNSRNTQRRADATNVLGVVQEYVNNNGGTLPTAIGDVTSLMTLGFYPASGFTLQTCTAASCAAITDPTINNVVLVMHGKCPSSVPASGNVTLTYSNRAYATVFAVETASSDQNQCIQS